MELTVKPLKEKDAGRRLAAIDRVAIDELDLSGGDFIWIKSNDETVSARFWPGYPEDDGTGVVRIDGRLRSEASVGIDDNVEVEKADLQPADSITIALPQRLGIRGNIGPLIRRELGGQPITQGQSIQLPMELDSMDDQSQSIPLKIALTTPPETVIITDSTQVDVSEKPAEQIGEVSTGGTADTSSGVSDTTNMDIGRNEDDEQARQGFAQWLIYMIRVSGIELHQLAQDSGVSRDRICRLIAGETMPTTKEVACLATATGEVENNE